MSENGFTPRQIDDFTLHDVADLSRWESDHPPVGRLVAAYMGVGSKSSAEPMGDPAELLGMIEAGDMRAYSQ